MPELSTLEIKEIFWSFQGEGLRIGVPSIFVRLSRCSLQCANCDTKGAWDKGEVRSIDELISEIVKYKTQYPQSQVVITGGEPLEQDLTQLVMDLKKRNYFTSIETNGLHFQDLAINWWTVSPKKKSNYFINENLLKKVDEIKLIVNEDLSLEEILRINTLTKGVPLHLQPDAFEADTYKKTYLLYQRTQKYDLKNVRCGVQLHKLYNVK
jgi:organic radical activating enzyme